MGTGRGALKNSSMAMPPMPVNRGAPRPMASSNRAEPAQTRGWRCPTGTKARHMARTTASNAMARPAQERLPCHARRRAMSPKPTGMMHCTNHMGTPPGSAREEPISACTRRMLA